MYFSLKLLMPVIEAANKHGMDAFAKDRGEARKLNG
jgi:hypothetical protein